MCTNLCVISIDYTVDIHVPRPSKDPQQLQNKRKNYQVKHPFLMGAEGRAVVRFPLIGALYHLFHAGNYIKPYPKFGGMESQNIPQIWGLESQKKYHELSFLYLLFFFWGSLLSYAFHHLILFHPAISISCFLTVWMPQIFGYKLQKKWGINDSKNWV